MAAAAPIRTASLRSILLSYHDEMKAVRGHGGTAFLFAASRCSAGFGARQVDAMRLGIERHGAREHFGLDGIHGLPFTADLFDDSECAIATVGAEGLARAGIEGRG